MHVLRRIRKNAIVASFVGMTTFGAGCQTTAVPLPGGHLPVVAPVEVTSEPTAPADQPPLPPRSAHPDRLFAVSVRLPGADADPVTLPKFAPGTPIADRRTAVAKTYPQLTVLEGGSSFADRPGASLGDLERAAMESNPALRRATAHAEAALGPVIQAGLAPNPTVGYQADQWQPSENAGQQGAFVNQVIKFPGKLSTAQAVAGFDYLNAQTAVRKTQVEILAKVRTAYGEALNARVSGEIHRALAEMADEVYRLQLDRTAGGESAGYEPLPLYAQSVQLRTRVSQAVRSEQAALKRLAAVSGVPSAAAPQSVAGTLSMPVPGFDFDKLRLWIRDNHTDVVTAQNTVLQSRVHLRLQELQAYPDLAVNAVVQHDFSSGRGQFNLQFGVPLPLFDRNQGAIREAAARITRSEEELESVRNDLTARLADLEGRDQANRIVVRDYKEKILPNLSRTYRAIVARYRVEPDKVTFNDVVTAQQAYSAGLQAYLQAVQDLWKTAIETAELAQVDRFDGP